MSHNWFHLVHMIGHVVTHLVNHSGKGHGESEADAAAAEAERQRLASEQAERERQAQAQAAHEHWLWEQGRPERAREYGIGTFVALTALGAFLGFAAGNGWFYHQALSEHYDKERVKEIAKGSYTTSPVGMAVAEYVLGRMSTSRVQHAVQDAAWPLILLAFIPLFGKGLDLTTILYTLFVFGLRGIIHLLTIPAALVFEQISGPVMGAIVIGLSFALWGVLIGLAVNFIYKNSGD